MDISSNGLTLIKSFEGFRSNAYKVQSTDNYYTIGYGHYGKDVKANDTVTESEAIELLQNDTAKFVSYVNAIRDVYDFNQNQFDALVSFTYNCGKANLTKLTKSKTRTVSEIGDALLLYTKSNGVELAGLVTRRKKENELFCSNCNENSLAYYPKYNGTSLLLDEALKAIGVGSEYYGSWQKRKPLANSNSISNYKGTATQNSKLMSLAKSGLLRKV